VEQQRIGLDDNVTISKEILDIVISHMNEEVKSQTEIKETLKWYGIVGGACLLGILTVGIWFNLNQVETKVLVEKVKGKVYYLDRTLNKHLEKH